MLSQLVFNPSPKDRPMKHLVALFAVTTALPTLALAQTQGTLGDSSFGSANISFNVIDTTAPLIQVTGFRDLEFDTFEGISPSAETPFLCIYMNEPGTFGFKITATPLSSDAFQDNVPYSVIFRELATFEGKTGNITDADVTFFGTGFSPSRVQNCTGITQTATLTVGFSDATPPAEVGTATSAVTLTVMPD